jgi:hypothetical protein
MRVVSLFIAVVCFGAGCDGVFGLTKVRSGDDVVIPVDACGAEVGHDEDHDGLDDGCDPCPFSAENNGDADGDGIAVACDPDPSVHNDVLMFEGFGPASMAELQYATIVSDAMHTAHDAGGASLFQWGQGVDNVWPLAGVRVTGANTSANYRELGFVFDIEPDTASEVFGTFCVLGKGSTEYVQAYASPNGATDFVLMTQASGTTVDAFSGTVRAYYKRNDMPQVGCTFIGASSPSISGTRTPLPPPGRLGFYVDDLDVEIDYVFVTTTKP